MICHPEYIIEPPHCSNNWFYSWCVFDPETQGEYLMLLALKES
jgi:hypothetical protein